MTLPTSAILLTVGLPLIGACSSSSGGSPQQPPTPQIPNFGLAAFTSPNTLSNSLFPFSADVAHIFAGADEDEREIIVIELRPDTKMVMGIQCAVVRDAVYQEELIIEDTDDWYAQDDAGNVWYMGEDVINYEYDDDGLLIGTNTNGSWEAGLDVDGAGVIARPGHLMKSAPQVGDYYYQEYYEGVAVDTGRVVALNESITLSDGTTYSCVVIEDVNPLEPGPKEHKYYAPGVGLVAERVVGEEATVDRVATFDRANASVPNFSAAVFTSPTGLSNSFFPSAQDKARVLLGTSGDEEGDVEVVVLDRVAGTRTVSGVSCAIVRDRNYDGELIIEDTHDWFAQDDSGNVWYMGEEVTNYEYDDEGNLLSTNTDSSWEAGTDPLGTGTLALPGFQMPASPTVGMTFYQEFYPGSAIDQGYVSGVGVDAELSDDVTIEDCIRIVDWNPLDPGGLEYKYYAPGQGLVLEEALHEIKTTPFLGTFDVSAASVPNFGAATFTQSTLIDHPLFPMAQADEWDYETDTEDGLELLELRVLASSKSVLGVPCVVLGFQEFLDGVIEEEGDAWFAQDDAGNVFTMGRAVTNYEYDDAGVLLGTDTDGSWEAGLDVAATGTAAQAGLALPAVSVVGASFYHAFHETVATDMGLVLDAAAAAVADGVNYSGCTKLLGWDPAEPGGLEHRYFAPGVGLVLEIDLVDGEETELVDG